MTTINVAFTGTWITDVADPTVNVHVFKTVSAEQDNKAGAVRAYAGGRRRTITGPATDRSSSLTFQRVAHADVEMLRAWRGRALLIRDFQGWRRFGTFFDLQSTAVFQGPATAPIYTVAVTWVDIDFTEGV